MVYERKKWILILSMILVTSLAVSEYNHWDERFIFAIKSGMHAESWKSRSIWLPDYKVSIDGKRINGIEENLSSIVYDYDQDRILGVVNNPAEIVTLTKTGKLTGRYELEGFGDIEGVTYMGEDRIAVVDESTQRIIFFKLPKQPRPLHIQDAEYLSLEIGLNGNKGFEGITYDAKGDRFYVVKERDPRKLYSLSGLGTTHTKPLEIRIRDLTDWIEEKVFATDLSDIYFDPETRHLIVLSDESKLLIEMTDEGELISYRTLVGWLSEMKRSAPQPEGVTLDSEGNLYVVSEPNLFYVFKKP